MKRLILWVMFAIFAGTGIGRAWWYYYPVFTYYPYYASFVLPSVSSHMNGMEIGAKVYSGGTAFRTWAPNASNVWVAGTFNSWSATANPMANEGNGYWSVDISGVTAGAQYQFVIENNGSGSDNPGGTKWKVDPAARACVNSIGNSIVVDPSYSWSDSSYHTPNFNDFIIYQLHVGTFAGYNDNIDMTGHGEGGTIAHFSDVETKFQYIKSMNFDAIELLPVEEFAGDRNWGYAPAVYFSPESAYGTPAQLQHFVNTAHQNGLAVIFDVVYNHAGPADSSLWQYDGNTKDGGGIYYEGGWPTQWGNGPALWKQEVKDFFLENAKMYFDTYHADGLRFDAATRMESDALQYWTYNLHQSYPGKILIAEYLPADPTVINNDGYDATWYSTSQREFQRAANGSDPVNKVLGILGWDGYPHSWNLVKYLLGSHDDCGDLENGNAQNGNSNWDTRHRYFVQLFGGRDNWHARAKTRMGWALNVAMPGTPMMFMGSECYMPGYWTDGRDLNDDHRFNWAVAGDPTAMPMRYMVADVNNIRWSHPALRSDTLQITHTDYNNNVIAFKRWSGSDVVLTVVNLSDQNFSNHSYGVNMGGETGHWQQIFNSQGANYDGWNGSGNYGYDPWVSGGKIYINLPKWSVLMFKKI